MTITRKPVSAEDAEAAAQEFIEQGGTVPVQVQQRKRKKMKHKEMPLMALRLPPEVKAKILREIEKLEVHVSMQNWVLGAVLMRLKKEAN